MGERILVIDDNAINRKVFEKTLELAGFTVVCAESGFDGLDLFYEERPDLIVLDMHMPHFTGADFLHDLRGRDAANLAMPVLMVSGDRDLDIYTLCPDWRNLEFMAKPIDTRHFVEVVRRLLSPDAPALPTSQATA